MNALLSVILRVQLQKFCILFDSVSCIDESWKLLGIVITTLKKKKYINQRSIVLIVSVQKGLVGLGETMQPSTFFLQIYKQSCSKICNL